MKFNIAGTARVIVTCSSRKIVQIRSGSNWRMRITVPPR